MAYGPHAIVLVVGTAGVAARHLVLPITIGIVVLLGRLVISYRQVIDGYPDGGGAYAVCRANLGAGAAQVAAASLVVDYTLTVVVLHRRRFIDAFEHREHDYDPIIVLILVIQPDQWYQRIFHNQSDLVLSAALRDRPELAVARLPVTTNSSGSSAPSRRPGTSPGTVTTVRR